MRPKEEMPIFKLINWVRAQLGKSPIVSEKKDEGYTPPSADELDGSSAEERNENQSDTQEIDIDDVNESPDQESFVSPAEVRKRNRLIVAGVIVGIVVIAITMSSQNNNVPKNNVAQRKAVATQQKNINNTPPTLDVTSLIDEAARQRVESEKAKREREIKRLKQEILSAVSQELENKKKQEQKKEQASPTAVKQTTPVPDNAGDQGVQSPYYPPPPPGGVASNGGSVPNGMAQQGAMPMPGYQPGSSFVVINGTPFAFEKPKHEPVDDDSVDNVTLPVADGGMSDNENKGNLDAEETYVPSGSFVKGRILTGADVPAPIGVKGDPYPILIHLTDDSFGPQRTHRPVKECFIIASGVGDLSSERALFRTNTISCEYADGSKLDTSVRGYVVDTDGRVGLRGKVVSRNGSKIAMTMLAGFGEGFGNIASQSASTQTIVGGAVVQSTDFKKLGTSSALAGIGKASQKLASYYQKMADAVFPVIEIPAMREVTVVVLKGFSLEPNIHPASNKQGK